MPIKFIAMLLVKFTICINTQLSPLIEIYNLHYLLYKTTASNHQQLDTILTHMSKLCCFRSDRWSQNSLNVTNYLLLPVRVMRDTLCSFIVTSYYLKNRYQNNPQQWAVLSSYWLHTESKHTTRMPIKFIAMLFGKLTLCINT